MEKLRNQVHKFSGANDSMAAKDATLSLVIVCIGLAGIYIGFIEKIWILYVGAILFTSLKSVKEVNNIAPAI